ncbi:methyltransferase domain-containing protein, partial [Hydrogenobaculum sp.]
MKRTCLMILGMHRSGTSAVGGVLQNLGVSMGRELLQPAFDNPKGFFENENIVFYNESKLLPYFKSSWHKLEPLDIEKRLSNIPKDLIEEASRIIEEDYKNLDIFGIKDPRMCILMPFWEKILNDLNIEIKCILPYRNPFEVANSLKVRDGFQTEKGLLLWAKHVLYAEYYSRNYKRVFIGYDNLLNNSFETIELIEKVLDIRFPTPFEKVKDTINDFLEKKLKHQNLQLPDSHDVLSEFIVKIAKLYEYLIVNKSNCTDEILCEFNILREEYRTQVSNYRAVSNLGNAEENKLFVVKSDKKYFATADDIHPEIENNSLSYIVKAITDNSTVLDVGCSYGYLGEWLNKNKNCQVYGIDIDADAISYVKDRGYYKDVFLLDLDYLQNTKDEYERFLQLKEMFDFIICGNVLEHLKNPTNALDFITSKLKFGGQVLVSVPNIAHMDIILNLLQGRFNYSEFGILDNTHLRFFTKRSFLEWIKNANEFYKEKGFKFDVKYLGGTTYISEFLEDIKVKYSNLYNMILSGNHDLEILQHIFVLTKINGLANTYNLNDLIESTEYPDIFKIISSKIESLE